MLTKASFFFFVPAVLVFVLCLLLSIWVKGGLMEASLTLVGVELTDTRPEAKDNAYT